MIIPVFNCLDFSDTNEGSAASEQEECPLLDIKVQYQHDVNDIYRNHINKSRIPSEYYLQQKQHT